MEKELLSLLQNFIIETRTAREIQTREIQEQMQRFEKKLEEMDQKFEAIDQKFAEQDRKFDMLLRNQDVIVLRLDALSEDVAELKRAQVRPPIHLATSRLKNNT